MERTRCFNASNEDMLDKPTPKPSRCVKKSNMSHENEANGENLLAPFLCLHNRFKKKSDIYYNHEVSQSIKEPAQGEKASVGFPFQKKKGESR